MSSRRCGAWSFPRASSARLEALRPQLFNDADKAAAGETGYANFFVRDPWFTVGENSSLAPSDNIIAQSHPSHSIAASHKRVTSGISTVPGARRRRQVGTGTVDRAIDLVGGHTEVGVVVGRRTEQAALEREPRPGVYRTRRSS